MFKDGYKFYDFTRYTCTLFFIIALFKHNELDSIIEPLITSIVLFSYSSRNWSFVSKIDTQGTLYMSD